MFLIILFQFFNLRSFLKVSHGISGPMKITRTVVNDFIQHFVNINSGFSFPDHTFRYVMCSAKRYSEGRMLKRNCFYMTQLSRTPHPPCFLWGRKQIKFPNLCVISETLDGGKSRNGLIVNINRWLPQRATSARGRAVNASETSFLASSLPLWCLFLLSFIIFHV